MLGFSFFQGRGKEVPRKTCLIFIEVNIVRSRQHNRGNIGVDMIVLSFVFDEKPIGKRIGFDVGILSKTQNEKKCAGYESDTLFEVFNMEYCQNNGIKLEYLTYNHRFHRALILSRS